LNWFDERAWYPLGRIVGGTVSHAYLLLLTSPRFKVLTLFKYKKIMRRKKNNMKRQ